MRSISFYILIGLALVLAYQVVQDHKTIVSINDTVEYMSETLSEIQQQGQDNGDSISQVVDSVDEISSNGVQCY